jgi:hypothetical protein
MGAVGVAAAATFFVDLVRPAGPPPPDAGSVRIAEAAPSLPATLIRWDNVDLGDEVIVVPSAGFTARHVVRPRANQVHLDPESGGGICGLPQDGVLTRMRRTDGPGPVLTRLPVAGVQPIDGPREATWMLFYLDSDSPGGWHCMSDLVLVRTDDVQRMLASAGQAS